MLYGRTKRARKLFLPFQNKSDVSTKVTAQVGAVEWSALVSHNEARGSIFDLIIFAISQVYIRDIDVKCETICYVQFTVFSDVMSSTFPKQIWTLWCLLVQRNATSRNTDRQENCHTRSSTVTRTYENSQLTLLTTLPTTSHRKRSTAHYSTCITTSHRPSITCSSAQLTGWHHCSF